MQSLPSRLCAIRRLLLALPVAALATLASLALPASASANTPEDLARIVEVTRERGGDPGSIGYDISYPQCGGRYPTDAAFAIVGVNGGRVFSPNPCLGSGEHLSQLAWAGMNAQFYANTGNPGPELSSFWPLGQTYPRLCDPDDPDTVECAYDYGWNAAADSYATAVGAYVSLGWAQPGATRTPVANFWWLDVEVANSWRVDDRLNVAALQGAVDYLESVGVAGVGFYSVGTMWQEITGGTDAFAAYPSWVAGASTLNGATRNCVGSGFTGGGVAMAQYFHRSFDANHRC